MFFISIIENFSKQLSAYEAKQVNILTLAYLGDTIHDIYIKSKIVSKYAQSRINDTHKASVRFVNANAQADSLDFIYHELTDEEIDIFKRGRNAKSMPTKNTDKAHYSKATGFECILGYLYLSGQDSRLLYILGRCFEHIDTGGTNGADKF